MQVLTGLSDPGTIHTFLSRIRKHLQSPHLTWASEEGLCQKANKDYNYM